MCQNALRNLVLEVAKLMRLTSAIQLAVEVSVLGSRSVRASRARSILIWLSASPANQIH